MATNDFLPFCDTDTGTNLLSQAEYIADAQRPIGNQPGVARSKLANKAIRQATYIASCLAQFISDHTGDDVLDDENEANVLATMFNAFKKKPNVQVFTANGNYVPSARCVWAEVIAIGGGGGSGGTSVNSGQAFPVGGGGGSGGVSIKYIQNPTAQVVTIGAGGAAGAASAQGGDGGDTTFGAILTGGGGKGGHSLDVDNSNGGLGGTATGGDLNLPGNPGQAGGVGVTGTEGGTGGGGGSAPYMGGGAGRGTGTNGSGTAGTGYGAGGGSNEGGFSSAAGNPGFHGAVIVIEHF